MKVKLECIISKMRPFVSLVSFHFHLLNTSTSQTMNPIQAKEKRIAVSCFLTGTDSLRKLRNTDTGHEINSKVQKGYDKNTFLP